MKKYPRKSNQSSLELVRFLRFDNSDECLAEFRFKINNKPRRYTVPSESILSSPKILQMLVKVNADLPAGRARQKRLVDRVLDQDRKTIPETKITEKTGWTQHRQFVFWDQSVPDIKYNIDHIMAVNDSLLEEEMFSGSLKEWMDGLAPLCAQSTVLTFAVIAALAGPTLHFFDPDIGIAFNLAGITGGGKTTALRVAQSVFKRVRTTDMKTLNITPAGLEEVAFKYNELVLCLDEFGSQASSPSNLKALSQYLSYVIVGGAGKERSELGGNSVGHETLSWRLVLFTSSEKLLSELVGNRFGGEEVRLIDIEMPPSKKGGIFDNIAGPDKSRLATKKLAKAVEEVISTNYGYALPDFAEYLAQDLPKHKKKALKKQQRFTSKMIETKRAPAEDTRILDVFGKLYATAVLAENAGVLPFTLKMAENAISKAYSRALGSARMKLEYNTSTFKKLFDLANDDKRCISIPKGGSIPAKRAANFHALIRFDQGDRILCVVPDHFNELVGESFRKSTLSKLKSLGILIPSDNADTKQVMVKGLKNRKRIRLFCLRLDA